MKKGILLTCLMMAMGLYAQQDTTLNRVVTVERDFQPVIQSAGKINQQPSILQHDLQLNPVVYSTYSTPLSVSYNIYPLPVAEAKFTPQTPLNGVLEGAIGHRNTHLLFGYQLQKGIMTSSSMLTTMPIGENLDWSKMRSQTPRLDWTTRIILAT